MVKFFPRNGYLIVFLVRNWWLKPEIKRTLKNKFCYRLIRLELKNYASQIHPM